MTDEEIQAAGEELAREAEAVLSGDLVLTRDGYLSHPVWTLERCGHTHEECMALPKNRLCCPSCKHF